MKKLKYTFAAVAIVTATLTMSFTMTNNDAKTANADNDCWSTIQRHKMGLPADINQVDDCPANNLGCCVKPDPNNPGQYLQFS